MPLWQVMVLRIRRQERPRGIIARSSLCHRGYPLKARQVVSQVLEDIPIWGHLPCYLFLTRDFSVFYNIPNFSSHIIIVTTLIIWLLTMVIMIRNGKTSIGKFKHISCYFCIHIHSCLFPFNSSWLSSIVAHKNPILVFLGSLYVFGCFDGSSDLILALFCI